MIAGAGLALVKLVLGLGVFVALGYLGRYYDKRVTGILLTFPILNAIGIITGHDPLMVANSVYAIVVFNGLILFFMLSFCDRFPRLPGKPVQMKFILRFLTWTCVWAIGTPLIIRFRDDLPGIDDLLVIQTVIALAAILLVWKAPARRQPDGTEIVRMSWSAHGRKAVSFWNNVSGYFRIGLFVLCCLALFVAAEVFPSKWVGMFSALPLPGLFAIAMLSVVSAPDDYRPMRDTVLIGALAVNVFNWLFAHLFIRLPFDGAAHTVVGIVMLVGMMAVDAVLLFWLTPRISAVLDRVRA
jgi:hypothetical protein